ncbi:hypothetical protein FJZ20_01710 [Candidatus Pacearchaeota archaeon]|nr:hypothetical protein [Candidatus Pacearchaeota archaeon]
METKKPLDILVVENNSLNQESARQMLHSYNLTLVKSFDEAEDVLRGHYSEAKNKKRFDVVLGDAKLAHGNGEMEVDTRMGWMFIPLDYPLAHLARDEKVPYVALLSDTDNPRDYSEETPSCLALGPFIDKNNRPIVKKSYDTLITLLRKKDLPLAFLDKRDGKVKLAHTDKNKYVKNWASALNFVMNRKVYS